ncbi:MAG: hypothetical protein PHD91_05010 [bacterium]|nr:hypothetical protein [bacterium]
METLLADLIRDDIRLIVSGKRLLVDGMINENMMDRLKRYKDRLLGVMEKGEPCTDKAPWDEDEALALIAMVVGRIGCAYPGGVLPWARENMPDTFQVIEKRG